MTLNDIQAPQTGHEQMDVDILIVGGGVSGLSCALSAIKVIEEHNEAVRSAKKSGPIIQDPQIVVLEKASEIGAHSLSGAVLNPSALRYLLPNYLNEGAPIETPVTHDEVYYLSSSRAWKFPFVPPPFHNKGYYLISLSKFNRWLATKCEEKGILIFPGFAATKVLLDEQRVRGVVTGDKGRDKQGQPKPNFEPGLAIQAKVTIFAEGTRGSLFKQLSQKLNLRAHCQEEVFEEGVKELIQCPPGRVRSGTVIHTLGFPLKHSVGGTFIYGLPGDRLIIGLVAYLDSKDPLLDPHRELQRLKTHPFIMEMIQGGQVLAYGGKTIPAGGWYSIPQLSGEGWMVCGDSASLVDVQKLKGIHLAMWSGIFAGETAAHSLIAYDFSHSFLKRYDARVRGEGPIKNDLYPVRNFHQALSKGFLAGLPLIAAQELTKGRGFQDPMPVAKDWSMTEPVLEVWGPDWENAEELQLPKPDGKLFFDKLGSVYLTGTRHDENSPNHLLVKNKDICRTQCEPKFKSPCTHFCPAQVYEMHPSSVHPEQKELVVNFTNCIHCKTCDIKCPFDNILWTPPEGGGGPNYQEM
ncbi:MAG: electron transfer flavoprotein-ubiquinone oxidoreductase [Pseudobdellovibrionaceae bacterium]|nr:electron transfer flavoprotein-ubiquinone oxidoreductase [Pseudobdellovibrionaceae bacterium]